MDISWGITKDTHSTEENDSNRNTKRRRVDAGHKKKVYELDDESMIYTVGTQVHFTAQINNDTVEALIKEITKVVENNVPKYGSKDAQKKVNITYIVDSPGGSVTAVLKFVDFISMVREKQPHIEFTSIITGMAASAGTTMCVIADHRCMTRNAFAMIHELSTGSQGKYTQLVSYIEFTKTMHKKLVDIYMRVFDGTKERLEDLLKTESWFDAEGYQALGLVTEIKG